MKKLFYMSVLMLLSMPGQAQQKKKISYVFDPLCGWCYGFSPVILSTFEQYRDSLDFEVVCGGMITGSREGKLGDFSSYILKVIPRLEAMTGVKFGEAYKKQVKEDSYYHSSVAPSLAVIAVRRIKPELTIPFLHNLQKAFYLEGKSLNDTATFISVAGSLGIPSDVMKKTIEEPETMAEFQRDLQKTQSYGVDGFPSLVGHQAGGGSFRMSAGYLTGEETAKLVGQYLRQ